MSDRNENNANSIPTPADFPVHWENPGDADIFWMMDMGHHPDPITQMDFSMLAEAISEKKDENYGLPIQLYNRHINTYLYCGSSFKGSPEERDAQFDQALEKMAPAIKEPDRRWKNEWLPEIKTYLDHWKNYDLQGASVPELLNHLDESQKHLRRSWEIHHLLVDPLLLAMDAFDEMFHELSEDAKQGSALELLSGSGGKAAESDHALWELSRKALASQPVRETISGNDAENVMSELANSAEGRIFLGELDNYLQEYGKRCYKLALSLPFWIEYPGPVIRTLQNFIAQPEPDKKAGLKKSEEQKETRLAEIRKKLQNYPGPVADQFESSLRAAQVSFVLMSDHYFWIEDQVTYYVRRVLLEFGTRLAASGCVETRDDIFYLTPEELKETAAKLPGIIQRQGLISERMALEKHFGACNPPPFLGTMPSEPPPDNPYMRMVMKFLAGPEPASAKTPQNEIKGHPGSPGSVQGIARVVSDLPDAKKISPGEILVTRFTLPSWTPLFANIAAVVTDSGGILSHSAIVAREYGIPAVVGAEMATSAIQDGKMIEVNGDTGIVRIIEL